MNKKSKILIVTVGTVVVLAIVAFFMLKASPKDGFNFETAVLVTSKSSAILCSNPKQKGSRSSISSRVSFFGAGTLFN